jgi:hypothetical protein
MPYFRDPYREERVIEVSETMARILRSRHWKEVHEYKRQPSTEDEQPRQQTVTDGSTDSKDGPEGREAISEQGQSKRQTIGVGKVSTKHKTNKRKA